jgi:hypothetical protein
MLKLSKQNCLNILYTSVINISTKNEEEDPGNRLYHFWPKFVARAVIDGELGIILTLHPDGFVEVDYLDPQSLNNSKGTTETGIIFHSTKTTLPLYYFIETTIDSQAV